MPFALCPMPNPLGREHMASGFATGKSLVSNKNVKLAIVIIKPMMFLKDLSEIKEIIEEILDCSYSIHFLLGAFS